MHIDNGHVLKKLIAVLGSRNVKIDDETLRSETANTLGMERAIIAVVYPSNTKEVLKVVTIAKKFRIPLYPISKGKNIGYGDKIPVFDGHIIVDLGKMNKIRSYDSLGGNVEVEPGVTQKQLFEFLKEKKSNFGLDTTGAGLDSSLIGNALEGGFGHTPKGNKRETVSNFEIVFGNGTVMKCGTFPGLGPDLNGLFVQSNFGIITSACVELMPIPECFKTFVVSIPENKGLPTLIDRVSVLKRNGTIRSLVHIANAVRYLITVKKYPDGYAGTTISSKMAQEYMSTPALKIGYWSATGGLYGTKREVRAQKKEIKKAFNDLGRITFFTDGKIAFLSKIFSHKLLRKNKFSQAVVSGLSSYKVIHGLMKGVPSDEPLENILWRVKSREEMGLIWYSPAMDARGELVRELMDEAEKCFTNHGFEMPVTITFVKPYKLVGIFSINFNRLQIEEKEKAYSLYEELKNKFENKGVHPYRTGIQSMPSFNYYDKGKYDTLTKLKSVLDPSNIIAPGRYGLGQFNLPFEN